MPQFCAAVNCANKSSKISLLSFFRFPNEKERLIAYSKYAYMLWNVFDLGHLGSI